MIGRLSDEIPGREWPWSRMLGLLATLLLHGLLLYPVLRGSHVILMPEKPVAGREQPLILVALAGESASHAALTVISAAPAPVPAILPGVDDARDASAAAPGDDPDEQARLLARYTAQLQSRISRAWRRPRSPISATSGTAADQDTVFRCQVSLRQDAQGRVQEIRLPACNGSPAWQNSLAKAIVSAAPLPPPDQLIPSETITLEFVGQPYSPGAPPDEYEPPPRDPL